MRIIQAIEKLRKELVELGTIKGFRDPEVISLSQKLDELIVAYDHLGDKQDNYDKIAHPTAL